jgi:hypothetical protein
MRYSEPVVLKAVRATLAIQGSKDSIHTEGAETPSLVAAYEADE